MLSWVKTELLYGLENIYLSLRWKKVLKQIDTNVVIRWWSEKFAFTFDFVFSNLVDGILITCVYVYIVWELCSVLYEYEYELFE